jgi:hypothetical protein
LQFPKCHISGQLLYPISSFWLFCHLHWSIFVVIFQWIEPFRFKCAPTCAQDHLCQGFWLHFWHTLTKFTWNNARFAHFL